MHPPTSLGSSGMTSEATRATSPRRKATTVRGHDACHLQLWDRENREPQKRWPMLATASLEATDIEILPRQAGEVCHGPSTPPWLWHCGVTRCPARPLGAGGRR
jgi:hypothetical protein